MTTEALVVGSIWREKKPAAIAPELRENNRRMFEVTDTGQTYATHGRVMGVSYWEEKIAGDWIAADWPGNRRRVGVLRAHFLRRFEHVRGPEASA